MKQFALQRRELFSRNLSVQLGGCLQGEGSPREETKIEEAKMDLRSYRAEKLLVRKLQFLQLELGTENGAIRFAEASAIFS